MYSRRFYGGDRTQRSRPAPTPQTAFEKTEPIKKRAEPTVAETRPVMALDIPVTEDREPDFTVYIDPKDFLPEASESRFYSKSKEVSEVSVYPENTPKAPEVPDSENDSRADTERGEDAEVKGESTDTFSDISGALASSDKTGDVAASVRNMTFEDMVLTGLLMLGSSGEYDDDIMLILGLILMIGA